MVRNTCETFRVVARVRPSTEEELEQETVVHVLGNNGSYEQGEAQKYNRIEVKGPRPGWYQFDCVFDSEGDQQSVFEETGAPIVDACCDGYNGAVFAYGQTGTGKTYTMLGCDVWNAALGQRTRDPDDPTPPDEICRRIFSKNRGLIPRAMARVLDYCTQKPLSEKPVVRVSYLEIYNEKVFDLLNYEESRMNKSGLEVREDKLQGVVIPDAVEVPVSSMQDVLQVLWEGAQNRAVSATDMNLHSSRSHTIFQVFIEQTIQGHSSSARHLVGRGKTTSTPVHMVKRSKLSLVDLAGSEKWRSHQLASFSEKRIQEMNSINQSLSCLGNVIRGLLEPGRSHIPYRNSKLTRLLQDSLGGNTKTSFIVTMAGSELSLEETISTLQFADRAKRVEVHPTLNEQPNDASIIRRLEVEVQRLRQALQARRLGSGPKGGAGRELEDELAHVRSQLHREKARCTALSRAMQSHRGNGQSVKDIQQLDEEVHRLAPRLTQFNSKLAADGALAPQRKDLLRKYHSWLQCHKIDGKSIDGDSLDVEDRLSLMEWSVLIQASELEQALRRFDRERIELVEKCAMKDSRIRQLEQRLSVVLNQSADHISNSRQTSGSETDTSPTTSESKFDRFRSATKRTGSSSRLDEYKAREHVISNEGAALNRRAGDKRQTVTKTTSSVRREELDAMAAWTTLVDPNTKRNYYYNRITKETTWQLPVGITATNPASNQSY